MIKNMELAQVRRGESFILDGVKFVKLDEDAHASFVLTRWHVAEWAHCANLGGTAEVFRLLSQRSIPYWSFMDKGRFFLPGKAPVERS